MIPPLSVKRENEYLRQELGAEEGYPRYQWSWSEDLLMPMVMIDDEGKVEYDYFCRCGKNVSVHSAECSWTTPKPKWEHRKLCPNQSHQWVLTKWVKPEASRDDWEATFGGVPYPARGYQVPVGDYEKCVALKSGEVPLRATTQLVIMAIRDHWERLKDLSNEKREEWNRRDREKWQAYYEAAKEAIPPHFVGDAWKGYEKSFAESPSIILTGIEKKDANE